MTETPEIKIYMNPVPSNRQKFRCDIDEGPGHHGTGRTASEALLNAAGAWYRSGTPNDK